MCSLSPLLHYLALSRSNLNPSSVRRGRPQASNSIAAPSNSDVTRPALTRKVSTVTPALPPVVAYDGNDGSLEEEGPPGPEAME